MNEILILEGGFNEEHEVSLKTAKEVKKILKKNKIKYESILVDPKNFKNKIKKYSNNLVLFNALHGPFGEDGKIQSILKRNKYKFTHSSVSSSKNCFNKITSKKKLSKYSIQTPLFIKINPKNLNEKYLNKIKKSFGQFVIKPNESGSSYGIKIIKNDIDFENLIKELNLYKKKIKKHKTLVLEKYINGKELTVSVLDIQNKTIPLEVTEIKSKNEFFDYESKYTKGFSKHILPAKIPNHTYKKCLDVALKAHKILECNIISRSDFIYDYKNKEIFYLETNTQPGLTSISLVPEQAKYKNISFEKIVLELIKNFNE